MRKTPNVDEIAVKLLRGADDARLTESQLRIVADHLEPVLPGILKALVKRMVERRGVLKEAQEASQKLLKELEKGKQGGAKA